VPGIRDRKIQIRDLENLDPGWKKSGSGINISEHISDNLVTIFCQFSIVDPDPGWKNPDPG
jgi:hypothetical protein